MVAFEAKEDFLLVMEFPIATVSLQPLFVRIKTIGAKGVCATNRRAEDSTTRSWRPGTGKLPTAQVPAGILQLTCSCYYRNGVLYARSAVPDAKGLRIQRNLRGRDVAQDIGLELRRGG